MLTILLNALSLLLIILAGYMLKRVGLVKKTDGFILSTIIMTLTLPATIIMGLNPMKMSPTFIELCVIAIIMNFTLVFLGKYLWKNQPQLDRILLMYCITGYNIGNFTLPFVQSFYPEAIPYLFMFDVGNCIMLAGGSKILVESSQPTYQSNQAFKRLTTTLLSSIPFLTYLFMFLLKVTNLTLPTVVITILEPFSKANGFLSLLMIGIYMELLLPKKEWLTVKKILIWRYFFAILLAGLFFFILPISNSLLKIVLTIICLAPIPTFSVINSVEAGVKEETAGFISSISIIISLILMTIVMLLIT